MDPRLYIGSEIRIYEPGSFVTHSKDAADNNRLRRSWATRHTAEDLAKAIDQLERINGYFRGPWYLAVNPTECKPYALDTLYLGTLGAHKDDKINSICYLPKPIGAFQCSMGVPISLNGYKIDLRAYNAAGWTSTVAGWHDRISRPEGGWPVMAWEPTAVFTNDSEYQPGQSYYNGAYSGLRSRFKLPPDPTFQVALFMAEPWKLRSGTHEYDPHTEIIYGDADGGGIMILVYANGKVSVRQRMADGLFWPLKEVRGGSIRKNTLDASKSADYHAFTVMTTHYGVAISTDGFLDNVMYWERSTEEVDGRMAPSDRYPKGTPIHTPADWITLTSNVGEWGFQIMPLSPAHSEYEEDDETHTRYAMMFGPALQTPHDWYLYETVEQGTHGRTSMFKQAGVEYARDQDGNLAGSAVLWPACFERGSYRNYRVPLKSEDHYMQPILEIGAFHWTSTTGLHSEATMNATYPRTLVNGRYHNYDDGYCGSSHAIDFFVSPRVYWYWIAQHAPPEEEVGYPSLDTGKHSYDFKHVNLSCDIDHPSIQGNAVADNMEHEYTPWIEDQKPRRITIEAWHGDT